MLGAACYDHIKVKSTWPRAFSCISFTENVYCLVSHQSRICLKTWRKGIKENIKIRHKIWALVPLGPLQILEMVRATTL
jgi:hypothetical protein